MNKNAYISPNVTIVTIVPECLVAVSLGKGDGEFDSGSMDFTKEEGDWDEVWDD